VVFDLIIDSGKTEFGGVPTKTCLAIGPDYSEKIDKVTGNLKLL
jgi:PTH2 family peptidyl-tRNA hydrolase